MIRTGNVSPISCDVSLNVLNISDENCPLNPVNLYYALPRGREFTARFKFYF
jgi:hypothetical protein